MTHWRYFLCFASNLIFLLKSLKYVVNGMCVCVLLSALYTPVANAIINIVHDGDSEFNGKIKVFMESIRHTHSYIVHMCILHTTRCSLILEDTCLLWICLYAYGLQQTFYFIFVVVLNLILFFHFLTSFKSIGFIDMVLHWVPINIQNIVFWLEW